MAFTPRKDVWFMGFGVMTNYHEKDWTLIVKWRIGDQGEDYVSDDHTIELPYSEKDVEKKWQTIDIRQLGVKPLKVSEGIKIHCMIKVDRDDSTYLRCRYGYSGDRSQYSTLPD